MVIRQPVAGRQTRQSGSGPTCPGGIHPPGGSTPHQKGSPSPGVSTLDRRVRSPPSPPTILDHPGQGIRAWRLTTGRGASAASVRHDSPSIQGAFLCSLHLDEVIRQGSRSGIRAQVSSSRRAAALTSDVNCAAAGKTRGGGLHGPLVRLSREPRVLSLSRGWDHLPNSASLLLSLFLSLFEPTRLRHRRIGFRHPDSRQNADPFGTESPAVPSPHIGPSSAGQDRKGGRLIGFCSPPPRSFVSSLSSMTSIVSFDEHCFPRPTIRVVVYDLMTFNPCLDSAMHSHLGRVSGPPSLSTPLNPCDSRDETQDIELRG